MNETAQPITVTFGGESYTFKAQPSNVKVPLTESIEVIMPDFFTSSANIELRPTVTKAVASYYQISESVSFQNAEWKPFTATVPFVISNSDGAKTVYLRTKNPIGESNTASAIVILKKTPEKKEASTRQHIRVSPNPIISKATIALVNETSVDLQENNAVYSLKVCDLGGKTLFEKQLIGSTSNIDFDNFKPGFYFISITNETTNLVSKVLKR